jgi:hypothetical protein
MKEADYKAVLEELYAPNPTFKDRLPFSRHDKDGITTITDKNENLVTMSPTEMYDQMVESAKQQQAKDRAKQLKTELAAEITPTGPIPYIRPISREDIRDILFG